MTHVRTPEEPALPCLLETPRSWFVSHDPSGCLWQTVPKLFSDWDPLKCRR